MKRVFAFLLSAVILFGFDVSAEQTAQATLTYTMEDSFFIYVPENIVVGEFATITASEVNIAPDKVLHIDISTGGADYVEIYNVNDSSQTINVYFQREDGTKISTMDFTVAEFASGSSGSTAQFLAYVENTEGKMAGDYTGTVMFSINTY